MKKISFLFLLHLFFLWGIWEITRYIIPFHDFPYKDMVYSFPVSGFMKSLAHFDGAHYISIAKDGYAQYEQAFFPLYPLTVHFVATLFGGNYLFAGFFVSNACSYGGLLILYKILKQKFSEDTAWYFLLIMIAYPGSFYLHGIYTEGLFLFFLALTWYSYQNQKYYVAFLTGLGATMTRLAGIFLVFLIEKRRSIKAVTPLSLILYSGPIVGLIMYCTYLYITTGDPLDFFHVQPAFGANRSTNIIFLPQVIYRYIKIFVSSDLNVPYFVAVLEFSLFAIICTTSGLYTYKAWRNREMLKIKIGLFSLSQLLLPTLTGTLSSIPRYALFSWASFLYVAEIKNAYYKWAWIGTSFVIQGVMFALFANGYFVS